MKIPPDYKITSEILGLISQIDAIRLFLSSLQVPMPLKEKIQRKSLLKSSLFSARIEGNSLTLENIEITTKKKEKKEVFNILRAIHYIEKKYINKQELSIKDIAD